MGELDKDSLVEPEKEWSFGTTEEFRVPGRYTWYPEEYGAKKLFTNVQSSQPRWSVKGTLTMTEPDYIKKIYIDINQLSTEQSQRFDRLEGTVEEIKTGIGEIRKEFKEEMKDKIKDVKDAFENRIGPFETSVRDRFDALSSQNKLIGGGIIVLLIGLLFKLLGWSH